jgi:hypothetical protein
MEGRPDGAPLAVFFAPRRIKTSRQQVFLLKDKKDKKDKKNYDL